MKIVFAVPFITYLTIWSSAEERFDGHQILTVRPTSDNHLRYLYQLENVDFWNHIGQTSQGVNLRLKPEMGEIVRYELNRLGIPYSIDKDDAQVKLDAFWNAHKATSKNKFLDQNYNFERYLEYSEIEEWMVRTARKCTKNLVCNLESIGKSFEGRDIWVFKIREDSLSQKEKKKIWIDAGIHAREWISPAVALFSIESLIDGFLNGNKNIRRILSSYDIFILSIVNPDGYVYTFTTNRLWRKSRSKVRGNSCIGADINRNFNYSWGTIGSSSDPCSDTYSGSKPHSEIETRNEVNYIMKNGGGNSFQVFITLHSYGQLWMSPWGYSYNFPDNYDELLKASKVATSAISRLYGTHYTYGSSSHVLYRSSGTSRDWAKGVPKIRYVYTVELRDKGNLIGLVIITLILLATIFGLFIYSGALESVVVDSGNPPIGKVTIAYLHGKGSYKDVGPIFTRIMSYLPSDKTFHTLGIYYDCPSTTNANEQRYIVGAILAKDDEKCDISLEEAMLQKGCKIGVVPQVDYAVITSFPFTTFLSIYLAIWKCYGKVKEYCYEKNLCAHPWIEVYTENRIKLFAPLSRQDDFYLEPFKPLRD
ncbi:DgyrCDS3866 [Dimorphilus gyrociliatus]|uniref:DgyrCDS3866 n=1 Tax=Dimorphilus gyrociliatus TaxID=2664684 RepID=A0A7I8VF85_9ANNE|nr:DgyrCDS3866 [Dimorphilus gyrociliatus]